MKHTFLNQEIPDRVQDLAQALDHYSAQFKKQNLVICQTEINGMKLSEADEARLSLLPRADIHTLSFLTEHPENLPGQVIHLWIKELPSIIQAVDQLAQNIRFHGFEGNLYQIVQFVETCRSFVECMEQLESVWNHQDQTPKKQQEWSVAGQKLTHAIAQTLSAFEGKDLVHFSEILEYDLGDALQRWLDLLVEHQAEFQKDTAQRGSESTSP